MAIDYYEMYTFDVNRDSTDFRDLVYRPSLIQLKSKVLPDKKHIHIRNQGKEGACTGFGLAAVIDLLNSKRAQAGVIDTKEPISTRMLYEMAKRYDRWQGEDYSGSSARGAMKGWHKHGVCTEKDWRYTAKSPGRLSAERQERALRYPLGAYYRVLRKRSDMQAALNEVGAVYVSAYVHKGWNRPVGGKIIKRAHDKTRGHAFAVVGYTRDGFIVQNSWDKDWSTLNLDGTKYQGIALWKYEDYEENLMDAWVARMALQVESLDSLAGGRIVQQPGGVKRKEISPDRSQIYHHYIHIDDGKYDPQGKYSSDSQQVKDIFTQAVKKKHIVFYCHGGLNSVSGAANRAKKWRPAFERNDIHEVHFIWETGILGELRDVLLGKQSFTAERVGGPVSSWWDKVLERAAWPLAHPLWMEMTSDAKLAFEKSMDGTHVLKTLLRVLETVPARKWPKLHFVGHSAGSVWLAHMIARWKALNGYTIENLIFFAPAATVELFNSHIKPWVKDKNSIARFSNFILDDQLEQDDDVGGVYNKSLLYMVSNSIQKKRHQFHEPPAKIIGMEKYQKEIKSLPGNANLYVSGKHETKTASKTHGGFDNDLITMNTMLKLVMGRRSHKMKPFTSEDLDD